MQVSPTKKKDHSKFGSKYKGPIENEQCDTIHGQRTRGHLKNLHTCHFITLLNGQFCSIQSMPAYLASSSTYIYITIQVVPFSTSLIKQRTLRLPQYLYNNVHVGTR